MVETGPEEGGYERALEYNLIDDLPEDDSEEDFLQYEIAYQVAAALERYEQETGERWIVQMEDDGLKPVIYADEDGMVFDSLEPESPEVVDVEQETIDRLPYLDLDIGNYDTGNETEGMMISAEMTDELKQLMATEISEQLD